jgi:hypothetical protein
MEGLCSSHAGVEGEACTRQRNMIYTALLLIFLRMIPTCRRQL